MQAPEALGAIKADELMPVRVAARRLGWNVKGVAHAKRAGLRTQRFGRFDYVLGAWLIDFIDKLADAQGSGEGDE